MVACLLACFVRSQVDFLFAKRNSGGGGSGSGEQGNRRSEGRSAIPDVYHVRPPIPPLGRSDRQLCVYAFKTTRVHPGMASVYCGNGRRTPGLGFIPKEFRTLFSLRTGFDRTGEADVRSERTSNQPTDQATRSKQTLLFFFFFEIPTRP